MEMKRLVSAVLFSLLFNGCLFSEDSKKNAIVGEWKMVTYKARYFENSDTSLSRQLNDNEWRIINHGPSWYSNIRFFEFKNSSFYMEHIDSSDSNLSKVESHDGAYKVEDKKLWLTFYGSPDRHAPSTTYPPLEIDSNSINLHLCYVNFTGSELNIFAPSYGKCPPSSEYLVPPKKTMELTISLKKNTQ